MTTRGGSQEKIFFQKVLKKKVSDTDTIDSKFLIKKLDNIHELYENLAITCKGCKYD